MLPFHEWVGSIANSIEDASHIGPKAKELLTQASELLNNELFNDCNIDQLTSSCELWEVDYG
jgi:hypothetical protein